LTKKKNNVPQRLMQTFYNMKQRCYNPKATSFKIYGGRGIIVCEEWLNDSDTFYNWALNNGYQEDLTIDRIEVNGNYEPDNCRWATLDVQANNRTNNVFIERKGEVKTISQWGHEIGVSAGTVKSRYEKGKDISEGYTRVIDININGEIKTMKELSEESGISYDTIAERHKCGWNDNDLINEVSHNETKYIEINGEIHTATEWAKISGLTREIILNRIQYGWKNEDLLKSREHEGKKKYIEIEGKYYTIDECCEIAGIHRNTLFKRIKSGRKGKDLITPSEKKYISIK